MKPSPFSTVKPVYEMKPCEILYARDTFSCAFIPVSPCFEWHGVHLPVGTDALIAEAICALMAQRISGIYFKPLSFGLDQVRPENELLAWGFQKEDRVFGMNFPDLPLASEYTEPQEMIKTVTARIDCLKKCQFRHIFIVNHHGGAGQQETLATIAQTTHEPQKGINVFSVSSHQFCSVNHPLLKTGGHAGLSETIMLLAFRPELVDLSLLDEGELSVRKTGILHSQPIIESDYNPRNALFAVAGHVRNNVINNFALFIEKNCLKKDSKG